MIDKLRIEIIMKEMRNQISDRNDFLSDLKNATYESRKNVSIEKLRQELNGINKEVFDKKDDFDVDELKEFEIIRDAINQLIIEKD